MISYRLIEFIKGFMTIMVGMCFYWTLFVLFTFLFAINESYIGLWMKLAVLTFPLAIFTGILAWYKTPMTQVDRVVEESEPEFFIL